MRYWHFKKGIKNITGKQRSKKSIFSEWRKTTRGLNDVNFQESS